MSAVDACSILIALGAHGSIAAILTAARSLRQLWIKFQAGDNSGALETHLKLLPIWNAIWKRIVNCCQRKDGACFAGSGRRPRACHAPARLSSARIERVAAAEMTVCA